MHRFYRSTQDRMLTGLCGGLAREFGVNPTLLRILFLVAIPLTSGAMLPIYFIASLVIPKAPAPPYYPYGPDEYGRDPYGRDAYGQGPYRAESDREPHAPRPLREEREFERPFPPHRPQMQRADLKKRDIPDSGIDAMMEDIEKKALKKEVEELKHKLSKYENDNPKGDL
ncbi:MULTISPECIES: PspC domain-containing protein [Saccharibacillus]|uniref:PspC domain-containing protein n=1 Tax=Saccharibacillus brassicae TaxID=2583377 RepID=A0A4Y6USE2_SACBS|nr:MULTISPECIES: PspC domain-containing protein [Saccharibacillus]MWJ32412.1 PspC domain-containing protein [Saccharibacillus sp. WB 17]QDH20593.1 PspC domain-containing protein [Saccharibacillus brassicae]